MASDEPERKRVRLPKTPGGENVRGRAERDRRRRKRAGKPGRVKHFNDGKDD